jgi:hypothetical protein
MSQAFYERFVDSFFRFLVPVFLIMVDMQFLSFYLFTGKNLYYYPYLSFLFGIFVYAFWSYSKYRSFRSDLQQGLLIPEIEPKEEAIEPLNLSFEDKRLKVCLLYRNGASLNGISKDMAFKHPTEASRQLRKGIGFLLRFYHEHEGENNER